MTKCCTVLGPTSNATTVVTEQTISGAAWQVPSNVRTLLGVKFYLANAAVPTADESAEAQLRIYSKDAKIEPCTVLAHPMSGMITTHSATETQDPIYYPINAPVKGGDNIYFYGKMLVSCTTVMYFVVTVYFSTGGAEAMPGCGGWEARQYHYEVGTSTAGSASAAASTSGAAFKINGSKITRVYVATVVDTPAAGKGVIGTIELTSVDFKEPYSIIMAIWPIIGFLGTVTYMGMGHVTVSEALDYAINPQTTIVDKFVNTVATTSAARWQTCVQFY